MTDFLKRRLEIRGWRLERVYLQSLVTTLALLTLPLFYLLTLARTPVLGDPSEYTFVAHILGIAHPPGYAFITLMGKLFQTFIPVGSIAWRMHLLSAVSATLAAQFVFGTVRAVANITGNRAGWGRVTALFAALTVGTAVNFWQHAIHANPHIITATFLAANLFFLTRWAGEQPQATAPLPTRFLYAFCLSAGLGITHHPLTVFAFPAYALFIVVVRPSILRDWRTLLKMVGFALLGLSIWLYFPIRSPMQPAFGPATMNTLNGFLDHVLARGLRVNLFHFGLADQPDRALVFWTLLRLQYSLPIIFLALIGLTWLLRPGSIPPNLHPVTLSPCHPVTQSPSHPVTQSPSHLVTLYGLAFLGNYLFVINTVQDVMAYLIGPFLIVGLLAGIGLYGLLDWLQVRLRPERQAVILLVTALFLLGPVLQVARNLPRVSLHDYKEGQAYITAVFEHFAGKGQEALLLNDWEHMTPLWYTRFVEQRWPDAADVRPEWVSTGTTNPWLDRVFNTLSGGPVYLSNYRREIVDAGFRLRPSGPFYQVVEPGESSLPPSLTPVTAEEAAANSPITVVGYSLPEQTVTAGDYVPFTLAMSAAITPTDYYVPVLHVGSLTFTYTTDSHLITPLWRAGEVIVERFDFALPHDLPTGEYPVSLNFKNLSVNEDLPLNLSLGTMQVTGQAYPLYTGHLLANFRQRVGLVRAVVRGLDGRRVAPWSDPLITYPGDTLHLTLQWQSVAKAEESYTVFVHLIDAANRPLVTLDYTPLGGATPTHLWIPKWLPGQRLLDPYRVPIDPTLPPGTYYLEVGLYEMVSGRRLHISDTAGNLIGDRYILGSIVVENQ